MRKKVVSLVMVLVLVVTTIVIANAAVQLQDELGEMCQGQAEMEALTDFKLGEGFSENQREALEWLESINREFDRTRSGDVIFPCFYGGLYLGNDGRPIVLIVESELYYAREHNEFSELISRGQYRIVEYSYTELNHAVNIILEYMDENLVGCIYANNVISFGVCERTNRVVIYMDEYSERMIEWFRNHVYDSPVLVFRQGRRFVFQSGNEISFCSDNYYGDIHNNDTYDNINEIHFDTFSSREIRPGDNVFRWGIPRNHHATVGFRVRRNSDGMLGFVSVAHTFDTDHWVYSSLTRRAGRTSSVTSFHRSVDTAFIIANDSSELSNVLPNGHNLSTAVQREFTQGTWVISAGSVTGIRWGEVRYPSHRMNINGVFVDIVVVNSVSEGGDSGGPVFMSSLATAGMIVAGDNTAMAFVRAHHILDTLWFSRY